MIKAAVRGIIDFRKARPYDKTWRRHAMLLLAGLRDELRFDFARTRQRHYCAQMSVFNPDKDRLKEIQDEEIDVVHEIHGILYPWAAKTKEQREKEVARHYIDRWQQRFGSLQEEETQERIRKTVEALENLRKPSAREARNTLSRVQGGVQRGAAAMRQMAKYGSQKGS